MNRLLITCYFVLLSAGIFAQSIDPTAQAERLQLGGFIDTYYAFDANRPTNGERSYTTQSVRHNEFNLNLAYVELTLERPKARGRLALQAGTSVQANYAAEPTRGTTSGPTMSRHVQEAVIGSKLSDKIWIDGGIYFSHLGGESFISIHNPTYSRSLVAEMSPYYQSGARLSYSYNSEIAMQVHVLNGWQNISENNRDKSLGLQWSYTWSPETSFTVNTLMGRESAKREFLDLVFKTALQPGWEILWQVDIGEQEVPQGAHRLWYGTTLVQRWKLNPDWYVPFRIEYFHDAKQVVATTNTANGFQVYGLSVGSDLDLGDGVLWRNEFKQLLSRDAIFSGAKGTKRQDGVMTTSLSLQF